MAPSELDRGDSWVPDACTLPGAERPLRVAEFDDLFAEALNGSERPAPDRLRLILRPDPKIAAKAAELAATETSCCSFFTFTLTITEGRLAMEITAHTGVLDALATRMAP